MSLFLGLLFTAVCTLLYAKANLLFAYHLDAIVFSLIQFVFVVPYWLNRLSLICKWRSPYMIT